MRSWRHYRQTRAAGEVAFNLTPMIDCTFLLIIFFILTSQMASQVLSPVELPSPAESQTRADVTASDKLIVNVLVGGDGGSLDPLGEYRVDNARVAVGDIDALAEIIRRRSLNVNDGRLLLDIRADWRADYAAVAPVMLAASRCGIDEMNITVRLESPQAGGRK